MDIGSGGGAVLSYLLLIYRKTNSSKMACDSEIQADLTVLKNHSKGAKHLKNVKVIVKNQPKISTMFSNKNEASGQVSRAEIKIAALISEHNLPIKLCDHLIPLLKDIFPDSKIAQGMQMGRTKATGVIKHVLAKSHFEELIDELKAKKFSILVDESTDIGVVKNICVCVRYFSEKTNETMVST
ncbi:unnamed protein product [Acanthoscelides obtectus]|uniref:DUF4371 domain-containing protein n=1 Tax=Acanthoscelides obtectus TaxID=200917 RepID=A0A9P0K7C6_ACAOB|nr:unnamed protein product [Acanthoscelides obtectus]CAK1652015.1 hypothetical protein AOBTE_LOCUS17613 [Acanthoscelides obtectus]